MIKKFLIINLFLFNFFLTNSYSDNNTYMSLKNEKVNVRYGPGLDKQQLLLGRITEIGTELFIIMAAVLKAESTHDKRDEELADAVFRNGKVKIKKIFASIGNNADQSNYKLGRKILDGVYKKVERVLT